jgi:hypothetical protein
MAVISDGYPGTVKPARWHILRYAIATGGAACPTQAWPKRRTTQARTHHFLPITDLKRLGDLLHSCDANSAMPMVGAALKRASLLTLRPRELRFAEWPEIDLFADIIKVHSRNRDL